MQENVFRNRLGRFILYSNLGFGILIVILYFLKGFDDNEFSDLLKILTPIKAVYLTALIRYVIANRNISPILDDDSKKITPLFARTSFAIIFVHITTLIVSTSLFALFNAMDFDVLINIIISVETFFGIYVGMFMASMFQVKDQEN
ncbi:MAG: hypothetical protein HC803_04980 [Saprospiraceae bacterium]|nr:hypothetical protein [Saprospiraceae bacterium]